MSDRWVLANQSQRRAVVNAVIEKIKVGPAKPEKGVRGHWDPSRFDVVWVA